jgi:hypothetical protein
VFPRRRHRSPSKQNTGATFCFHATINVHADLKRRSLHQFLKIRPLSIAIKIPCQVEACFHAAVGVHPQNKITARPSVSTPPSTFTQIERAAVSSHGMHGHPHRRDHMKSWPRV